MVPAVADPELRGSSDPELFQHAAADGRRVVTENIKDFRPLLLQAVAADSPAAALLLAPPRRFPHGRGEETTRTRRLDAATLQRRLRKITFR